MQTAPRQIMRRFIRRVRPGALGLLSVGAAGTGTLEKKPRPSRRSGPSIATRRAFLLASTLLITAAGARAAINLSPSETRRIGNRIWQNECGGTITGLTSWNTGENFASLGIGHFIWYPKGERGPFEESFPKLVSFVSARGAKLPQFLLSGRDSFCPWNSRAEFQQAIDSA